MRSWVSKLIVIALIATAFIMAGMSDGGHGDKAYGATVPDTNCGASCDPGGYPPLMCRDVINGHTTTISGHWFRCSYDQGSPSNWQWSTTYGFINGCPWNQNPCWYWHPFFGAPEGPSRPAPDVNCGGPSASPSCGGGGGGQVCNINLYLAPGGWYTVCGGNNWRQIHVDFSFLSGPGCQASIGFGASGGQASRCNSGHADAYYPSGLYGNIFGYNSSPFPATVTGIATT
jgi:hypothetical protein